MNHFGEFPPNAGQLFMLCVKTNDKELFFPATMAFLNILSKTDISREDKAKIVRKIEQRIDFFSK